MATVFVKWLSVLLAALVIATGLAILAWVLTQVLFATAGWGT